MEERVGTESAEKIREASRVFNVLFISVFSAMLGLGIIVPLLPFYAESLGASGIWIGIIFSGFAISRAVFMPVIGNLSDRRGRRSFILVGLLIYTLLSLAYIAADSVYLLTAVRVLHGFASAMVIPIAMAYIADFAPHGEEGRYMGTFMIALFLGMGLGPLIGGVLQDLAGMNAVFLAMSFFSGISLLICLLLLPESCGTFRIRTPLFRTFLNRAMRPVLLFRVMNAFANGTFMVFLPLIAATLLDLSASEIGILISVSILSTALLQRAFGTLADRYGRVLLIVLGTAMVSASLIAIPYLSGFPALLVASAIVGLGGGVAVPAATAVVTVAGREIGQGSAMGAFNTAMSVGMVAAPLICGAVMDIAGVACVFLFSGIVSFLSIGAFWWLAADREN
ncbi:MFS transporter [Methanoculleus taiwanensis]|uniref:MFS transporter n=1 Tax=Methanoculleus taiwanensis TaxID=1550565 RepID=A0A498H192_9EURY|nr:MFS transporter [Methanoculleus taiwanensis]RXE55626.1 MFS transporter [Methanoculleus taiwanensis]